MFHLVLLTLFVVYCSAAPTDHQFQVRENVEECYKMHTFSIVYTELDYDDDGNLVPKNTTKQSTTRRCCEGYKFRNEKCLPDEYYVVCGNVSCSTHGAECITFEKCGKEISLFIKEGSIVSECYEGHNIDLLSCSGVCVQDPCAAAVCPAFDESEVSCFVGGCDCHPTWIRLTDRAEVDCRSGEVVGKERS